MYNQLQVGKEKDFWNQKPSGFHLCVLIVLLNDYVRAGLQVNSPCGEQKQGGIWQL